MNVWVGRKTRCCYYLRGEFELVGCVEIRWTDDLDHQGDWNDLRADYEGWNDEISPSLMPRQEEASNGFI